MRSNSIISVKRLMAITLIHPVNFAIRGGDHHQIVGPGSDEKAPKLIVALHRHVDRVAGPIEFQIEGARNDGSARGGKGAVHGGDAGGVGAVFEASEVFVACGRVDFPGF